MWSLPAPAWVRDAKGQRQRTNHFPQLLGLAMRRIPSLKDHKYVHWEVRTHSAFMAPRPSHTHSVPHRKQRFAHNPQSASTQSPMKGTLRPGRKGLPWWVDSSSRGTYHAWLCACIFMAQT